MVLETELRMFREKISDIQMFGDVCIDLTCLYTQVREDTREASPIENIIKLNEKVKKLKKIRDASIFLEINDDLKDLLHEICIETISMLMTIKEVQKDEADIVELKSIFNDDDFDEDSDDEIFEEDDES